MFNLNTHSNVLNTINNDSDKKNIKKSLFKLFNLPVSRLNLNLNEILTNNVYKNDLNLLFLNEKNIFLNNQNLSYKIYTPFSSNQFIFMNNRTIKLYTNLSPATSVLNFSSKLNALNTYLDYANVNIFGNNFLFYNLKNSNYIDLFSFNKISSNRFYSDYPFSPISSNSPILNYFDFDSYKNTDIENAPTLLQGKEDQMPIVLPGIY
jgi:hypothetical protein